MVWLGAASGGSLLVVQLFATAPLAIEFYFAPFRNRQRSFGVTQPDVQGRIGPLAARSFILAPMASRSKAVWAPNVLRRARMTKRAYELYEQGGGRTGQQFRTGSRRSGRFGEATATNEGTRTT